MDLANSILSRNLGIGVGNIKKITWFLFLPRVYILRAHSQKPCCAFRSLCQVQPLSKESLRQYICIMKAVLTTLLTLLPLLAQGTESFLESRQGRCKITGNDDVNCMLAPLAGHVVRKIPPGTELPVTCQMPGRPDEP